MQDLTLAFGGRFDNNVANYQMELQKYLPACVGITFNCSQIAEAILRVEAEDKQSTKTPHTQNTYTDFFIGSSGATLTPQKIKLMRLLQQDGYRVHVDYSKDMHTNLNKLFLDENNVRFLVQVQEDTKGILFADRLGFLNGLASLKSSHVDSYS